MSDDLNLTLPKEKEAQKSEPTAKKEQVISESQIRELLQKNHPVITLFKGTSMNPMLKEGKSVLTIVPLIGEPKIGDVILFSRSQDGQNVLHRLVKIEGDTYITRGDNCLGCERSKRDQIFGILKAYTKKGKEIDIDSKGNKRYTRFIMSTWFLRRIRLKTKSLIRRIIKK